VSAASEVMGEFPISCLAEEIETPGAGQVKALISVASNAALSSPHGTRLSAALEQLEFMVSLDVYLNETTRHADVILPGNSPLEEMHYAVAFPQLPYRNQARYSAPVLHEHRARRRSGRPCCVSLRSFRARGPRQTYAAWMTSCCGMTSSTPPARSPT